MYRKEYPFFNQIKVIACARLPGMSILHIRHCGPPSEPWSTGPAVVPWPAVPQKGGKTEMARRVGQVGLGAGSFETEKFAIKNQMNHTS